MKRIIAVLLAVVLVISGLGSVAYAQDPVSGVELGFHTSWIYQPPGDIFTQSEEEVTGERKWFATLVESTEPVLGMELSLTSNLPLGWFYPEPETIAPPTYEWSFGDISKAKAGVGFAGPDPSPVDFFPGFDASRTVGPTVFTVRVSYWSTSKR
jgi:hypothetical protein